MKSVLDRYFPFVLTVPAHTPRATPLEIDTTIDNLILADVGLQIPNGHVGVTGLALFFSGQQILPWDQGTGWIQGDNLITQFPVNLEVGPGTLTWLLFNEGNHDHSFYLRLHVQYLPDLRAVSAPVTDALVLDDVAS